MGSILSILGIIGWVLVWKGATEGLKTQGYNLTFLFGFFIPFLIFIITYGTYYAIKFFIVKNEDVKDSIYRKIFVDSISFLFITMLAVSLISISFI